MPVPGPDASAGGAGCRWPGAGGCRMPAGAGCRVPNAGRGIPYRLPVPDAGCRMPVPDAGKQKMYIMKLSGRHRFWRILSSVQHTNFTDAAAKSTWQTQTSNSAVISCRANFVFFQHIFL